VSYCKHCKHALRISPPLSNQHTVLVIITTIDKQLVQNVEDPLEKTLLGRFKLAYMSGKGTKYLVLVLIPTDLVTAIRKLVAIRDVVGVAPNSPYVFANLQNSPDCLNGWHCVRDICLAAGVEKHSRLTATTMRHLRTRRCSSA